MAINPHISKSYAGLYHVAIHRLAFPIFVILLILLTPYIELLRTIN